MSKCVLMLRPVMNPSWSSVSVNATTQQASLTTRTALAVRAALSLVARGIGRQNGAPAESPQHRELNRSESAWMLVSRLARCSTRRRLLSTAEDSQTRSPTARSRHSVNAK